MKSVTTTEWRTSTETQPSPDYMCILEKGSTEAENAVRTKPVYLNYLCHRKMQ